MDIKWPKGHMQCITNVNDWVLQTVSLCEDNISFIAFYMQIRRKLQLITPINLRDKMLVISLPKTSVIIKQMIKK